MEGDQTQNNENQDVPAKQTENKPYVQERGGNGPTSPITTPLSSELPVGTRADDRAAKEDSENPDPEKRKAAIRTYHSDIAESVQRKKTSLTNIVLAEKRRAVSEGTAALETISPKPRSRISVVILGALIVFVAAGILTWTYYFGFSKPAPEPESAIKTPIAVDKVVLFDFESTDTSILGETLGALEVGTNSSVGDLIAFIPTSEVTINQNGPPEPKLIIAREFLEKLFVKADSALLRSIEEEFLLFGYNRGILEYGLIFDISLFDNAFAGMLRWEEFISEDLSFLSKNTLSPSREISTTTPVSLDAGLFVDKVIENKDVRILKNTTGEVVLLYTFPDTNTLIITGNVETLKIVLDRLTRVQFQQ